MLYSPPKHTYRGLSIVLSNPSRFDKTELLSAIAGWKFNQECLYPELNRFQCEVRLAEDPRPFIPGTKCVLLLGQRSLMLHTTSSLTIPEIRGTPLRTKSGIPAIASFFPQDANDVKDYEGDFNLETESATEDYVPEEVAEKKRGKTQRSNYFFWLKQDVKRAITVINNDGKFPVDPYPEPTYEVYPSVENVIKLLETTKGQYLYIDLETDLIFPYIRCVGFAFGLCETVYTVPWLTHEYHTAYDMVDMCRMYRAFAIAFRDNTLIAHNGMIFDFFILCWVYKIPVGRLLQDTMLMHQRAYVEVEKSLGHCMSHLTWQPYHKNEGVHTYRTSEQAFKLWSYCGKDVFGLFLVHRALLRYSVTVPGLPESMTQLNKSIYPYLLTSLRGVAYDKEKLDKRVNRNDRWSTQMIRLMQILMGKDVEPLISNKKCCRYFHELLGYKVMLRSKTTLKPSLNEKALLKLRLNYQNPVIDALLSYRKHCKETSVLGFTPWNINNDTDSKCKSARQDSDG